MDKIIKLDNVKDYNYIPGTETLHPLVSVLDMSHLRAIPHCCKQFVFYCVFLKDLTAALSCTTTVGAAVAGEA